mmetsp:Transcript_1087/g.962  ORF Transcript_1087/g.962 Transcript_1087/m.962 type:complete len:140 (-) Transcript_1087:90-509(-)|eukprot:CAMPEP_0205803100 /NCGR_PEP_ID=MMETSP0205-20121125/5646_1 /ASSEMBLY_ACC=CAM_ASM_000278 /TAXON_ID=36767 /ORGANISM="Euplotes focardii, Strain TN1" /LENGTH=139 /DNA_ID=CAMNT_0053070625 /DNA_START=110 /DNA_END=526 /DNA_ORIENTATION=-
MVSLLLDKNALFVTPKSKLGDILCLKGKINDLKSIELFNKAGADFSIKNYDGKTLAHFAAVEENMDMLTYLARETQFDFDIKDRLDKTPYDEIKNAEYTETLKKLVNQRKGNDTESSNEIDRPPTELPGSFLANIRQKL